MISSLDFEQFDVRIDESGTRTAPHPCRNPCCIFRGLRTVGISIFRWVIYASIIRPGAFQASQNAEANRQLRFLVLTTLHTRHMMSSTRVKDLISPYRGLTLSSNTWEQQIVGSFKPPKTESTSQISTTSLLAAIFPYAFRPIKGRSRVCHVHSHVRLNAPPHPAIFVTGSLTSYNK